jgi:hypothetical protein
MYTAYCPNCKKETGYKRSLGFGTLFAVMLTGGLWLIAILFYPTRCSVCGGSEATRKPRPEANKTDETKLVNIAEYQNWAEEFIYQFDRDVTKVSSNPGNPVNDYDILLSFFDTIKEKSLDTRSIRGLENKKVFEQTLSKARQLIEGLEKKRELQNYIHQPKSIEHLAKDKTLSAAGIALKLNVEELQVKNEVLRLYQANRISRADCERLLQRKLDLAERPMKDWV